VDYPYRDTRTDMGTGTGTIFIQRGGDGYHTTRTRGYLLTSLDASTRKASYDRDVDFLVDLSSDLVPSLTNFSFAFLCVYSLDDSIATC